MATRSNSTPSRRRVTPGAWSRARGPGLAASAPVGRRQMLEGIVDRALSLLDALDAPYADREPEVVECGGDAEASAQPVTLAPARAPVRRLRLVRRVGA